MPNYSPFPTEFASQILALKQQRIQQEAELNEIRRSRQAQEALEKSRVSAAGQAAFWASNAREHEADAQAEIAKAQAASAGKAADARIALESDRLKAERESIKIKALNDLAINGTAFIPTDGYADYIKHRAAFSTGASDAVQFWEKPIPGMGVLVRQVSGGSATELAEIQAKIQKTNSEAALMEARAKYYESANSVALQKASLLKGKVSASDAERIATLLQGYQAESTRKAATAMASGDTALATALQQDWTSAFDDTTRKTIGDFQVLLGSYASALNEGVTTPKSTDPRALEIAGMSDVLGGLPAAAPAAAGPAPAPGAPALKLTGVVQQRPNARQPGQPSQDWYTLSDGRTVTGDQLKQYQTLVDDATSGKRSRDDPSVIEAIKVITAILSSQGFSILSTKQPAANE